MSQYVDEKYAGRQTGRYLGDLSEGIHNAAEKIDGLEVTVVVNEQLHLCAGVSANVMEHFQHPHFMVEGAIFALEDSQEDVSDEHFQLCLEVRLEALEQTHEDTQRESRHLRHVGCAIAQQRHAQVLPNGKYELVS